jgi:hypothetical protein
MLAQSGVIGVTLKHVEAGKRVGSCRWRHCHDGRLGDGVWRDQMLGDRA